MATTATAVSGKLTYKEHGQAGIPKVIAISNNSVTVEVFYTAGTTTHNGTLLRDSTTANYAFLLSMLDHFQVVKRDL